jgi:hypothetical protein
MRHAFERHEPDAGLSQLAAKIAIGLFQGLQTAGVAGGIAVHPFTDPLRHGLPGSIAQSQREA